MCGVIGIIGHDNVNTLIYDGLITLQHRGQDAAGILTYNKRFHLVKDNGLVADIFGRDEMLELQGNIGIGHVRYVTVGGGCAEDAQPFVVNSPYGIGLAHNGNVTNFEELREELLMKNRRHVNSSCDAEAILNVFADGLLKHSSRKPTVGSIFESVGRVFKRVKGAYSVVSIIGGYGLLAFRDPHGIRPLVFGKRKVNGKTEYIFASETVTLDILGFELIRDVKNGEAIFIDKDMRVHSRIVNRKEHTPCIFEYVYFARPDSILDEVSVYKTRLRLGDKLAEKWKKTKTKADVVIPVPDTSRPSGLQLAFRTGIKYREGLIKNRYIGRTFIMPGQKVRKKSIRFKLNPIKLEIRNKKVLLVDDSIVRGNTSRKIIEMVRNTGAEKVFFASYSAPLKYPCVYGIDMSTKSEFIARGRSVKRIAEMIKADKLVYQDLEDMIEAARVGNPKIKHFCTACFTGKYPTRDVTQKMLKKIEKERVCSAKAINL
ncbi:amidophosphoribosyltransferase [Candidatus Woesearchaeota archaeon]|nr:MAG: amidophosphoribosyltransferase [Candidatus Woesearchaeota archaeon]